MKILGQATFNPDNFKYLVLVRDNVLYHYKAGAFRQLCGDGVINSSQIVNTDILYSFPDSTTIFKEMKAGRCLDRYIISAKQDNITLLNSAKFGVYADNGDTILQLIANSGTWEENGNYPSSTVGNNPFWFAKLSGLHAGWGHLKTLSEALKYRNWKIFIPETVEDVCELLRRYPSKV